MELHGARITAPPRLAQLALTLRATLSAAFTRWSTESKSTRQEHMQAFNRHCARDSPFHACNETLLYARPFVLSMSTKMGVCSGRSGSMLNVTSRMNHGCHDANPLAVGLHKLLAALHTYGLRSETSTPHTSAKAALYSAVPRTQEELALHDDPGGHCH